MFENYANTMKDHNVRILPLILLLVICPSTFGKTLQDVIYLKNESIIRGVIIEHLLENDRYKIQLTNGEVFSFEKRNIIKIKKEPSVVIENTIPPISSSPSINSNIVKANKPSLPAINQTISIGNLWHSVSRPYSNTNSDITLVERFNGIKLNYQKNHTKHIASRYGFEYAKLDRIEVTNESDEVLEAVAKVDDNSYTGLSATIVASSNLQRGFRIYVGAGLYNHHYFNEVVKDQNYIGTRFELGGGYMWQDLSLTLQYQWHGREQYPDDIDSIFSGGLEIGMAF
mgnify:CR=1 FL=1